MKSLLERVPDAIELIRTYPSPDATKALSVYPSVRFEVAPMPEIRQTEVLAYYSKETGNRVISLSNTLDKETDKLIASVIMHELLHAANDPDEHLDNTNDFVARVTEEATQTVAEVKFYQWLYRNDTPPANTQSELLALNKLEYLVNGDLYQKAQMVYAMSLLSRLSGR